ncbi:hypothetical protein PILCRDRAFT_6884 [Piloderma croceum F 1598]|uniref:Uncharacterized protein n=1 Tax=Piloderma croceum (strain F 1598) TaxID=765440 RepID=A0A0C3BCK0_PILCF|nr:hypothetical protein PILCRDRAFT_6884 [Piloderma croceum F 1598]
MDWTEGTGPRDEASNKQEGEDDDDDDDEGHGRGYEKEEDQRGLGLTDEERDRLGIGLIDLEVAQFAASGDSGSNERNSSQEQQHGDVPSRSSKRKPWEEAEAESWNAVWGPDTKRQKPQAHRRNSVCLDIVVMERHVPLAQVICLVTILVKLPASTLLRMAILNIKILLYPKPHPILMAIRG